MFDQRRLVSEELSETFSEQPSAIQTIDLSVRSIVQRVNPLGPDCNRELSKTASNLSSFQHDYKTIELFLYWRLLCETS